MGETNNAANHPNEYWDNIEAVDRMQAYIVSHIDEEITLQKLSEIAGYSLWHSLRIFKELLGQTPFEVIRAVKLTKAAESLRDSNKKVIDVALENGFDSHDGFTRAFSRQFNMTPQEYKDTTPPIAYFTFTPIKFFYLYVKNRSVNEMEKEKVSRIVTTTVVERPARKLLLLRSKKATDYFSFCEEVCCEWHGVLNSVPEKFDNAALITLPQHLVTVGTSATAAGIEVPADYAKSVPKGYEIIDLPPCTMLYFQGASYTDEQHYCEAIDIVANAVAQYDPEPYGWRYAPELAPYFNFGASAAIGAKMARPVRKI